MDAVSMYRFYVFAILFYRQEYRVRLVLEKVSKHKIFLVQTWLTTRRFIQEMFYRKVILTLCQKPQNTELD